MDLEIQKYFVRFVGGNLDIIRVSIGFGVILK